MDQGNRQHNMRHICSGGFDGEVRLLMEFVTTPCDVADPLYFGVFALNG